MAGPGEGVLGAAPETAGTLLCVPVTDPSRRLRGAPRRTLHGSGDFNVVYSLHVRIEHCCVQSTGTRGEETEPLPSGSPRSRDALGGVHPHPEVE